ncbi:hypothetical protein PYCCODRAFT_1451544 [Trametes coccinea BRFM310]|uniref:Uncharacterized protein n=1 Tax=Trametes coccinea (strain BRFM310) TaxID=1353009 RepID=A0A1Y2IRT8_TRAC3|nr:hypothetical protein PYCCODRAFT_1451544 [Trametes coccinea BRFM310]
MFSALTFGAARPFDLAAALQSWNTTNADHPVPEFKGKPKRKEDPTTDAWLVLVEKGCSARSVPKAHWPAVAKHFMGKKARSRVLQVEKVMHALHGEQWEWRWKDFKLAVMNMGWNIEETKTRQVQVERKSSGLWWIVGGKDETSNQTASSSANNKSSILPKKPTPTTKSPGGTSTGSKLLSKTPPPKPSTSKASPPARTGPLFSLPALPFLRPAPQPQQTILQTITAQVPLWLLAATEALSTLSNEHPDVLTAVAAAIVAVGTVSTGGSAAVAAIGEAAVVMGRALKNAHDKTHSH